MIASPITVLLLEDNPADAHLIRLLLAGSQSHTVDAPARFELLQVERLADGLAYLGQMQFHVILLDLSLPDSQGLETFEKIKENVPQTAVVVLTGLDDQQIAHKAMQQGAQDYLVKGSIERDLLIRALLYAVERQNLLTELQEKTRALEQNVIDHIAAKAQLTQQALELQRRNAELDEFAHTVAHQVQGLLGQIIGYSSFIEMNWGEQLHEEPRHALNRVLYSSHKMNNVLSEILLLASVNREDVQTIPLEMGRIVAEACKRLSFEIAEYRAEIHQVEQWPAAQGYPSWVEEVWVNYIGNGLKYGGQPPILHLGAEAQPDGMIRFWLRDNGQGIAPEDQMKLFKPHTRLRPTRARGEGLGLSIVRRIVEKCGGKVGVDSQPGQGSTFWFCLPPG